MWYLCVAQIMNEEYLDKFYKTQGTDERFSWQDMQLACMADPDLTPFQSRSVDMRVLTGQTSLFYKARQSAGHACLSPPPASILPAC